MSEPNVAAFFDPEDSGNVERLHPDLQPWVMDGPLGKMLNHPLVQDILFVSWKRANAQYEAKLSRVHEYLVEDRFEDAIWFYERPYRLSMVDEWVRQKRLSLERAGPLLAAVWIDTELPDEVLRQRRWVRLFRRVGFVSDGDARLDELPEHLTVYRGAENVDCPSWTTDLAVARWFAHRFRGPGAVFMALIPKAGVLAVLDGRGEHEVVVDPRLLQEIKEVTDGDVVQA